MSGTGGLPLAGRRVLVTRAAHQAGKLSSRLRALGAEPVEIPVLEMQPPWDLGPLDAALREIENYDWLIVTSANTVEAVVARIAGLGLEFGAFAGIPVAAVGRATAEAAAKAGLRVELVPDSYISEGLVEAMREVAAGKRVLLARAMVARDVIPEALSRVAAVLTVVDAYETVRPAGTAERLRDVLATGLDAVAFTSSSSVKNLAEAAGEAGLGFPFAGVKAVSIGAITSGTLRELGWEPAAEASPMDIGGLVGAIVAVLG